LKPCHIDGLIYVLIAFFGAASSALSQDDAAKYIEPATLWLSRNLCTAIAAALLALKMFRSTAYSDYLNKIKWVEKQKENPDGLHEPNPPLPPT